MFHELDASCPYLPALIRSTLGAQCFYRSLPLRLGRRAGGLRLGGRAGPVQSAAGEDGGGRRDQRAGPHALREASGAVDPRRAATAKRCDVERRVRALRGRPALLRELGHSHQVHVVHEGAEGGQRVQAERAAGHRRAAAAAAVRRAVPLHSGHRRALQVQHRAPVQAADRDREPRRARHGGVSGEVQRELHERVSAELSGVVCAAVEAGEGRVKRSAYDCSEDVVRNKDALCERVLTLLETQGRVSEEWLGKILEVGEKCRVERSAKRRNRGFLDC